MEHPPRAPVASARTTRNRLSGPRWRLLSEGRTVLIVLLVLGLPLAIAIPLAIPLVLFAAVATALTFRDPERVLVGQPRTALSPADGRVIHVGPVWDTHCEAELTEIVIFLALWDVHIQRAPMDGVVMAQHRRAGGYRNAMTQAATHGNNQLATYLMTEHGPCVVTQISGLIARRIVTWAPEGTTLVQGERLGMIKFGSQVTLRLPTTATVVVEVGDKVRGGLTPVARLAEPATPAQRPAESAEDETAVD